MNLVQKRNISVFVYCYVESPDLQFTTQRDHDEDRTDDVEEARWRLLLRKNNFIKLVIWQWLFHNGSIPKLNESAANFNMFAVQPMEED